jgi:hypothetical protein
MRALLATTTVLLVYSALKRYQEVSRRNGGMQETSYIPTVVKVKSFNSVTSSLP